MKLKQNVVVVIILVSMFSCERAIVPEWQWLDEYNVVWNSQSKNSSESMPCGGGDIGMNVWVENGDVLFYIDRSGNIDENDQQRKFGRVRINMNPNPFTSDAKSLKFEQKLDLKTGSVYIQGSSENIDATVHIWAEVKNPRVHVELESNLVSVIQVSFESWRNDTRIIPERIGKGRDFNRWGSYGYLGYKGDVFSYSDSISFIKDNSILFYHQNNNNDLVFDKQVHLMRMDSVADKLVHPTQNRIFGGILKGDNLVMGGISEGSYSGTPFKSWNLKSTEFAKKHSFILEFHTEQVEDIDSWKNNLFISSSVELGRENLWNQNLQWWSSFWNKSYIIINKGKGVDDSGWQVGRNYQLFRYMLACNAYGKWPMRFNGGLFTYDSKYVKGFDPYFDDKKDHDPVWFNPDYRAWGAWTAQNQRLVYWPMLKSGDFEMMLPQFEFYKRNLPNAKYRNIVAWNVNGCSFSEQIGSGGLPTGYHYGWEPPYGSRNVDKEVGIAFQHTYYYSTQLEFAYMIHEMNRFTGADISEYIPFLKDVVTFHFEYHKLLQQQRNGKDWDENGKIVLSPGHACETYRGTNPANLVAALYKNIESIIKLPEKWVNQDEKKHYKEWLDRLPSLSFRERNGLKTIAPVVEDREGIGNRELPQLYPVFPYGIYGLGLADLDIAINTWRYGLDHWSEKAVARGMPADTYPQKEQWWGWTQQAIMLARMGLTEEAREYVVKKLSDARGNLDFNSKERMRFPTFYGPRFDWTPDINWGASGMIAIQEMLLQTIAKDGKEIRILPAWPKDWDVEFKLHAPENTTIECVFLKGEIRKTVVTPVLRGKDLVFSHFK